MLSIYQQVLPNPYTNASDKLMHTLFLRFTFLKAPNLLTEEAELASHSVMQHQNCNYFQ